MGVGVVEVKDVISLMIMFGMLIIALLSFASKRKWRVPRRKRGKAGFDSEGWTAVCGEFRFQRKEAGNGFECSGRRLSSPDRWRYFIASRRTCAGFFPLSAASAPAFFLLRPETERQTVPRTV